MVKPMETSKFLQMIEGRIAAGIYIMLGRRLNFFILGLIVSEDGKEMTVHFKVEDHTEAFRWNFNVEELNNEN